MESQDRFEALSTQVERIRLQFIVTEVETAFTFIRVAERLYSIGSATHADRVLSKAWKAHNEAVHNLKLLTADRVLRDRLTAQLEQVRVALGALTKEERSL